MTEQREGVANASSLPLDGAAAAEVRTNDAGPKQRQSKGHLRTQIAVDWFNNILFVLDKYRLLAMDFDGNNELLLIDDFTPIHRPVELKVDPGNNFLFWLQQGQFHTTIYKLDLNVLSLPSALERMNSNLQKLSNWRPNGGQSKRETLELSALISHHYAHPIITNLPKHTKLFLLDHKHSRIYVPYVAKQSSQPGKVQPNEGSSEPGSDQEAEVFSTAGSQSQSPVTHMNTTNAAIEIADILSLQTGAAESSLEGAALTQFVYQKDQILAFNLDGTDVGPLRSSQDQKHLANIGDMQDLALDADRGFLYWLTNEGQDLFEEYKTGPSDSSYYSASHNLNGLRYTKLLHFNSNPNQTNQPAYSHRQPGSSPISKLLAMMADAFPASRWTRSNLYSRMEEIPSSGWSNGRAQQFDLNDSNRFAQNAPLIILAVTCLLVFTVYLIYTLLLQPHVADLHRADGAESPTGSFSVRSSYNGACSQADDIASSNANTSRNRTNTENFFGTNTIRRWIQVTKPSSSSTTGPESATTTNREYRFSANSCVESTGNNSCYIPTTATSNAIDEHYRQGAISPSSNLANLSEWPLSTNDMSNKLYIPVEILNDEVLASIRRISMSELEIERRAPLGEGHFGTVLQAVIRDCSPQKRIELLGRTSSQARSTSQGSSDYQNHLRVHRNQHNVISSSSSGHGSSSASEDFNTATNITSEDYLTPRSHCNSMSDYEPSATSIVALDAGYSCQQQSMDLRVAIKKLKDNASAEEKRDFLQEAKLLADFDHPNIVHLIGICLDRGSTLIVMELMLGGDLIRYMQENKPRADNLDGGLSQYDLLSICLDIVNGCCYLEELNYIHRDLAARNCLVSSRKREERVVKLADFGLARDIYKDSYYKQLNGSAMPLKWMAPECLTDQKFTTRSDVWSFGVVLWEVSSYCQEKPYGNIEPFFMKEHLASGRKLEKPVNCDDDMYRLMNKCWQLDPNERPTFNECRAILIEIRNKLL